MNPIFIAVLVLLGILVAGLIGLRLDLVTCDGRTRMSSMGVRAILERAGYSEVRRVEVDDGCYAALARDKQRTDRQPALGVHGVEAVRLPA